MRMYVRPKKLHLASDYRAVHADTYESMGDQKTSSENISRIVIVPYTEKDCLICANHRGPKHYTSNKNKCAVIYLCSCVFLSRLDTGRQVINSTVIVFGLPVAIGLH